MNQDTQNIYEAYITESPDQIAKIDKRIARLQKKKAQLQQSGDPTTSSSQSTTATGTVSSAPTTSSSTSTTTTGAANSGSGKSYTDGRVPDGQGGYSMPPESPEKGTNNDWSQFNVDPQLQQSYNNLTPSQKPVSHSAPGEHPTEPQTEPTPPVNKVKRDRNSPERIAALKQQQAENPDAGPYRTFGTGAPSDEESAAASAAIDSGEISSKPGPWQWEQERINQTAPMPDNWQNASWAKRARTMGGRNPTRVKQLAQKEWERKEAMRKEREMATSELNPNRQTGAQYLGNQLKKMPGNISAGLQGLGSAIFGKNKIPQTTAAGDAVRDANGKLQWKDNSTGKPGLVQRAGGAVKKALTPSKPAAAPAAPAPAAPAPAAPVTPQPKKISGPVQKDPFGRPVVNRRKSRVLNQSTNAFDAVLQDKNVDHLID